jgi:hypothetical protein
MTRSELIQGFIKSGMIPADTLSQLGEDTSSVVGSAMDAAVLEYSSDVPRKTEATGEWSGEQITLDGWDPNSSAIRYCEHPTDERPRKYVVADDRELDAESGTLFLLQAQSGKEYRISYTVPHSISNAEEDGEVTLGSSDIPAFYQLALAYIFNKVAGHHAESMQSDIGADTVSHTTKTDIYLKLEANARTLYALIARLPEKKNKVFASAVVPLRAPSHRHFPDTP